MAQLNEREHGELLMLIKNVFEDIERSKREQWTQFYAIILAQIGVASFARSASIMPRLPDPAQWIWLAVVMLMLLGLMVIIMHQLRLHRIRALCEKYCESLEKHSQDLRKMKEARSLHQIVTPALMTIVMLGVFFFIIFVVLPANAP